MEIGNLDLGNPNDGSTPLKCRLCLSAEEEVLLDIFSEEVSKWNIVSKLNIHCSLTVLENDWLPRSICLSCLNEVSRFSDFYNRIQENQKLLITKFPACQRDEFAEEFEVVTIDETQENSTDEEGSCEYATSDVRSNKEETEEDDLKACSEKSEEELADSDEKSKDIHTDINEQIACDEDIGFSAETSSDANKSSFLQNAEQNSSKKWLKRALKCSKNKEGLKNLLEEYNAKSKVLILPSQKSGHRISLDEPIREFFDLSCPHCNFAFLTFVTMKKHMETVHKEQSFLTCCNKKLYRREAVMEHINFHLNPNKFTCHICKQVCKSKVTLKVHLKQHIPEDQRPFRCKTCGQSFVLNSQLKSHEKSHLSDNEKKYVCEKCGKAFAFRFVLEKHKQHKHIGEKNFMCEICARSFVDKVNLTAHKRTHDNSIPRLQCPHCDALLKNKITLKIHMRIHNPESHTCSKCDKVLSTKNALLNHMQYVHGGKLYPCTICNKVFKKTLTLKEHMTTHTGEVLYNCQHCDKSFNAKANMYSHVKKVHRLEWAEQRKLKWGIVS